MTVPTKKLNFFRDFSVQFNPVVVKQNLPMNIHTHFTVYWTASINSKDLDSQEFFDELKRDDIWDDWLPGQKYNLRKKYAYGKSQMFDSLLDITAITKHKWIEQCYKSHPNVFSAFWRREPDFYLKKSFVGAQIIRDLPGYKMNIHQDNSEIISQYIFNLTDNSRSTTNLYGLDPANLLYKGSGDRKKGLGFLNTSASLHSIEVLDNPRYILYLPICQDVQTEDKPTVLLA